PQDIVRHEGTIDEGLPGFHMVAGMDEEPLAVRHQMLALDAAFALDDDRPLAAALLLQNFDNAIDLGHDSRVLWLAGLEDFRDARQTTRDIADAGSFTGRFAQHGASTYDLAFIDHDMGPLGQV